MKKSILFVFLIPVLSFGQDLDVKQLSKNVYQYTSWSEIGDWGLVGSNGLIIVDNGKALLVDTPMDEPKTKILVAYINDSLKAKVELFVPGHWHGDCVGGLDYLNSTGVKTYANQRTNAILNSKKLPVAQNTFQDSVQLKVGKIEVDCYYLGGGHATDNIVVWIPSEKILFGGCMVKDNSATSLGNTADAAPLPQWSKTIDNVLHKFQDAKIVVPGHGEAGGTELLQHTKELLK